MTKIEIALTVEQIAESIGQLPEPDQRRLAALLLHEQKVEPFIEELDDSLSCEKASEEDRAEPFTPEELMKK